MSALKCLLVLCLMVVSGNGQEVPRTVTTNMNLKQQRAVRELFTSVVAQTSEGQHCEFLTRGLSDRNLFTAWGCLKYTPDTAGGNYYINTKNSQLIELEIPSTSLRYVIFSLKKLL